MADDSPHPEPPEGYELGSVDDATVDEDRTRTVWVEDDDAGKAYWFELRADVPLRKKNEAREANMSVEEGPDGDPETKLSSDYYTDMLQYMVVDWFGNHDDDVDMGLATFFASMTSAFESLQEEVPPPFGNLPDDTGK